MTYIPTNWSNMNSFGDFLAVANTNSGGFFWNAMNIMIFAVIFITLATGVGWEAGILTASFVCLIIQMLLVYLGLGSMHTLGIYVGAILGMIIYLIWRNRYD